MRLLPFPAASAFSTVLPATVAALLALGAGAFAAEEKPKAPEGKTPEVKAAQAKAPEGKKVLFQYKSEGIEVPGASAEEARVKAFGAETVRAAAKYLDAGAHHWVREKSCVACHSTGVYMVERSALTAQLGRPSDEILQNFIEAVPKEGAKDGSPIKSVWRSSGLASWDKHVEGKLAAHTDRSLRGTMSLLDADGSFHTIKQVEIPYITTHFELTVQAARALVTAPGWLAGLDAAKDAELLERIGRMKKFLREHEPISDFELALKLQLAGLMPELVPQEVRSAAAAMLWKHQLADGGWSLRRMSDLMKWHETMDPKVIAIFEGEPDKASPGSDSYMTAWAIVLLRESGVPAEDARIQKGIAWLKREQRETGRWWMKSLYRGTYHYSTYIATAQSLRALALCGELGK